MSLNVEQLQSVEDILRINLRKKFQHYRPEPASMPFHTRLLGKDRMALFSFIHSLNTNFGTSIFEPVAAILASFHFKNVQTQQVVGNEISEYAQRVIQEIIDNLTTAAREPDKIREIETIRTVCQKGRMIKIKPTRIDLMFIDGKNKISLFDLKTAKPNVGSFKEFKRTLLEWVAVFLLKNPKADISTVIAIPYNPYEPKPYNRWTMKGMLDLSEELKVAEEFWDFLGGQGTYNRLLDCFEHVGIELKEEINDYFSKFK